MHQKELGKIYFPDLKKEHIVFLCNVWSQYRDSEWEVWPGYNTVLHLDHFCHNLPKWSEAPYVQTFMSVFQNPFLCPSRLTEALESYPNSERQGGLVIQAVHIIIQKKLYKLDQGPHTSFPSKLDMAFNVSKSKRRHC